MRLLWIEKVLYAKRLFNKNPPMHKKIKFFIKDYFSKYDQIHRKLRIWSHLLRNP